MGSTKNVYSLTSHELLELNETRELNGWKWSDIDWKGFGYPLERGSGDPKWKTELKILNSHPCPELMQVAQRELGTKNTCDVHLICSDGYIPVHRVFIQNVLKLYPDPNSFIEEQLKTSATPTADSSIVAITLMGVKMVHLKAVISLMYRGEAILEEGDEAEVRGVMGMLQINKLWDDLTTEIVDPGDPSVAKRKKKMVRCLYYYDGGGESDGGGDKGINNPPADEPDFINFDDEDLPTPPNVPLTYADVLASTTRRDGELNATSSANQYGEQDDDEVAVSSSRGTRVSSMFEEIVEQRVEEESTERTPAAELLPPVIRKVALPPPAAATQQQPRIVRKATTTSAAAPVAGGNNKRGPKRKSNKISLSNNPTPPPEVPEVDDEDAVPEDTPDKSDSDSSDEEQEKDSPDNSMSSDSSRLFEPISAPPKRQKRRRQNGEKRRCRPRRAKKFVSSKFVSESSSSDEEEEKEPRKSTNRKKSMPAPGASAISVEEEEKMDNDDDKSDEPDIIELSSDSEEEKEVSSSPPKSNRKATRSTSSSSPPPERGESGSDKDVDYTPPRQRRKRQSRKAAEEVDVQEEEEGNRSDGVADNAPPTLTTKLRNSRKRKGETENVMPPPPLPPPPPKRRRGRPPKNQSKSSATSSPVPPPHPGTEFSCIFCADVYASEAELEIHLHSACGKNLDFDLEKKKCKSCSSTFGNLGATSFMNHVSTCALDRPEPPSVPPPGKKSKSNMKQQTPDRTIKKTKRKTAPSDASSPAVASTSTSSSAVAPAPPPSTREENEEVNIDSEPLENLGCGSGPLFDVIDMSLMVQPLVDCLDDEQIMRLMDMAERQENLVYRRPQLEAGWGYVFRKRKSNLIHKKKKKQRGGPARQTSRRRGEPPIQTKDNPPPPEKSTTRLESVKQKEKSKATTEEHNTDDEVAIMNGNGGGSGVDPSQEPNNTSSSISRVQQEILSESIPSTPSPSIVTTASLLRKSIREKLGEYMNLRRKALTLEQKVPSADATYEKKETEQADGPQLVVTTPEDEAPSNDPVVNESSPHLEAVVEIKPAAVPVLEGRNTSQHVNEQLESEQKVVESEISDQQNELNCQLLEALLESDSSDIRDEAQIQNQHGDDDGTNLTSDASRNEEETARQVENGDGGALQIRSSGTRDVVVSEPELPPSSSSAPPPPVVGSPSQKIALGGSPVRPDRCTIKFPSFPLSLGTPTKPVVKFGGSPPTIPPSPSSSSPDTNVVQSPSTSQQSQTPPVLSSQNPPQSRSAIIIHQNRNLSNAQTPSPTPRAPHVPYIFYRPPNTSPRMSPIPLSTVALPRPPIMSALIPRHHQTQELHSRMQVAAAASPPRNLLPVTMSSGVCPPRAIILNPNPLLVVVPRPRTIPAILRVRNPIRPAPTPTPIRRIQLQIQPAPATPTQNSLVVAAPPPSSPVHGPPLLAIESGSPPPLSIHSVRSISNSEDEPTSCILAQSGGPTQQDPCSPAPAQPLVDATHDDCVHPRPQASSVSPPIPPPQLELPSPDDDDNQVEIRLASGIFECSECDLSFKTETELDTHQRSGLC